MEGVTTEPDYIDAIKRMDLFRESVSVDIQIQEAGMQPMTLVERARSDKRSSSVDIDHYWCVFDVESPQPNPNLDRAVQMARDNDIKLSVSNPCFELWLILHFQDQTAYLSTDDAISLRARLDGSSGKEVDGALYMPRVEAAMRRAAKLRARHFGNGTPFPDDNPSSSFDLLIGHLNFEVGSRIRAMSSEVEVPDDSS